MKNLMSYAVFGLVPLAMLLALVTCVQDLTRFSVRADQLERRVVELESRQVQQMDFNNSIVGVASNLNTLATLVGKTMTVLDGLIKKERF